MIKEARRDSEENKTNEMEVEEEEVVEVAIKPNEEEPTKKDQCTKKMDKMGSPKIIISCSFEKSNELG